MLRYIQIFRNMSLYDMKTYSLLVGKSLANLFDAVFKIHDNLLFFVPKCTYTTFIKGPWVILVQGLLFDFTFTGVS